MQPLKLSEVLTVPPEDAYFGSRAFQCSIINAAVEVASKAAELYADLAALPEALAPAQQALKHIAEFTTLPQASRLQGCSTQKPWPCLLLWPVLAGLPRSLDCCC